MTFDTAGTPSNDAPLDAPGREDAAVAEGAAPAKKPARRRATRKVAAPPDPSAPQAATEASGAPSAPAGPESAAPAADVSSPAAPVTAEPAAAPVVATTTPEPAPAAPARRSRRVTRTVVLPDPAAAAAPEQPAVSAPVAATPAASAPVEPAPVEPAPVVDAPAAPAAAARAPVADAPAADAEPAAAPRKRAPRRSRKAAEAPVEVAPVVEPDPAPAEDEDEEATAESAAPESAAPTAPAPAAPPALDVLAELAGTVAAKPPAEPRTGSPRLATTALLFQAPDPDARPRRRRAQSPAGTPQAISEAAAALHTEEPAAEVEAPAAEKPAAEKPATTRPSRRRGRRGAAADAAAEAPVEEPTVLLAGAPDLAADLEELVEAEPETAQDEDAEDQRAADGDDADEQGPRRRRRRGGRGRRGRSAEDEDAADDEDGPRVAEPDAEPEAEGDAEGDDTDTDTDADADEQGGSSRRRRRRRSRSGRGEGAEPEVAAPSRSRATRAPSDEVTALRGSTRLEAKRQRRREGRDAGRRRQIITESEFLARRESVERTMVVRERDGRTQIAVLEDGVLVEHYVSRQAQLSMAGNVYLGRVQNVLPSMEAAFVDVGKGRNAVLYAGEVNWDAAGLEGGQPRRIEQALKSGDSVLVQVTKDPIGHKGARLTSQITLAGRYLVYVPGGGMTGISRKLPDVERNRLKKILREIVPESAGVIVRTAAEGASEDELRADIARLQGQWESISKKAKTASAPALLQGEPDLAIRVVRDIFNDDFSSLVVQGDEAWSTISGYIGDLAPDLASKVSRWTAQGDVFAAHRVDEQLAKGMDRKVWLPSGGSLVIDRTEAMTVVDVNTGKFTGSGGTLEETVTRNNLEAAEEIVRQLRLRDIGGIIVIDFIDMVLELNRDLVLRRLVECLGRDRTKHQVAEVTSLGLVQMTRKRVGQGLVEAFSETCEHCNGRGFIVHADPIERSSRSEAGAPQHQHQPQQAPAPAEADAKRSRRKRGGKDAGPAGSALPAVPVLPEAREAVKATLATIAAAAAHAHEHAHDHDDAPPAGTPVAGGAVRVADAPGDVADAAPTDTVTDAGTAPDAGDAPGARSSGDGATFRGAEGDVPEPAAPGAAGDGEPRDADLDAEASVGETLELTPVDPSTFDVPDDADDADEADDDERGDAGQDAVEPVGSEPGDDAAPGSSDAREADASEATDRPDAGQPTER
ncbi:ribonuclease E/G [Cellulomonas cellasea]|uniref:Ribonuclease E n=1 Tax=Cellulomonas cellasea TaxID=43670 RepID=A0A7W4UCM7_9CELL|nr:ribonuclease E/G [Cellulomonas cellasea]MBB2921230.1 ribonuclease E [Cellulomonas cellasea]